MRLRTVLVAGMLATLDAAGGLFLQAELTNPYVGMHLTYAAACVDGARDISIAASRIKVAGLISMDDLNRIETGVTPGTPLFDNPSKGHGLAPRVGFAWAPFGSIRTSVKGGTGIFYQPLTTSFIGPDGFPSLNDTKAIDCPTRFDRFHDPCSARNAPFLYSAGNMLPV